MFDHLENSKCRLGDLKETIEVYSGKEKQKSNNYNWRNYAITKDKLSIGLIWIKLNFGNSKRNKIIDNHSDNHGEYGMYIWEPSVMSELDLH